MENSYVSSAVFAEYQQRLEDQKARWDRRLENLENNSKQIHALSTSIQKLAASVEQMAKEQERQGARLEKIENRDGEMWRKAIGYILTALATAAVTFIFSRLTT